MENSDVEFQDAITLLEKIESGIIDMLIESFNEVASLIEEKNIDQLSIGQRSDGSTLPNYSINSVRRFGKPSGPIKLFETGDFYKGIEMIPGPEGVTMIGTDPKSQMLELRYGTQIVGLQESSLAEVENDYIVDILREKVFERLTA